MTRQLFQYHDPIGYHFIAPSQVQSPHAPAVWGWDPRPNGAPSSDQVVSMQMHSRGRATGDPADDR